MKRHNNSRIPTVSPIAPRRSMWHLFAAVLISLTSVGMLRADTTVAVSGIGTSLSVPVVINTQVDSVTYSAPAEVTIQGIAAYEIRGTVSGVGWGGNGIVDRAANAHYRYEIPFVARWRKTGSQDRLVFYNHGGGLRLIDAVKRDKASPLTNTNRFAELSGDRLAGVPALLDGATYISINRRGLRGDGTFSAYYLPEVAPLDAGEIGDLQGELAAPTAPGNPVFFHPGLVSGAPVPVLPTNDATTFRDIARALERVVGGIQGKSFRTRIAVGSSSGARLLAALNFGRSVSANASLPTGGNHVIPYDTGSPRIFDAFILYGFTYIRGKEHAEPAAPFSAPTMFIQGQADQRYQQHVTMAHELLQKGVCLNGLVWIYEIKSMTHMTRDVKETPAPSEGDLLGCFISAAIGNMRAYLEQGKRPPLSRMAGRIVDCGLQFDQARGRRTNVVPVANDPALDRVITAPNLHLQTIGPAETARWRAVKAALPHVRDAITPPTVACRLGGYRLTFFGAQRVPRSPKELRQRYGSFTGYYHCLWRAVACLEAQRLYDARVESAVETAELARSLFGP